MSDNEVTTIPKVRRVFYDTYANLPTTGLAAEDLGYATDTARLYRWSGAAWQPITIAGATSSGYYTGNDGANRAIPHGLGVAPSIVIIASDTTATQIRCFWMIGAQGRIDCWKGSTTFGGDVLAVTVIDATNFYVGNATSYVDSANENAKNYYWVAIK